MFGVEGLGFRLGCQGLGLKDVWGVGCTVLGSGLKVWGVGFRA